MEKTTAAALLRGIGDADARPQLAGLAVTGVQTDSRKVGPGDLFVAIPGEHVDGHDYAVAALRQGAVLVLGQRPAAQMTQLPPDRYLQAPDVLDAMITLGGNYRAAFDPCLVGVTGSVGKTTTKEFLAAVLSAFGETLKTEGNQNNEIGMPNTLLRLAPTTRYAVVEMGMQGLGEIAKLTHAARPAAAVITCIGVSHLEKLGSRENILKAKLEICQGLPPGGLVVLNGDDSLLSRAVLPTGLHRVAYGVDDRFCPVRAINIRQVDGGQRFTIQDRMQGTFEVFIPAFGGHNVYNALAAYTLATRLGLDAATVAASLARYQTVGHRQHLVEIGGGQVMEDCYNANPESMRAALQTLRQMPVTGNKMAVLADMLELGAVSEAAHREAGTLAAACGVQCLLTYGQAARLTADAALAAGVPYVQHFDTRQQIAAWLLTNLRPGDYLLLKGSHSMALEEILPQLYSGLGR